MNSEGPLAVRFHEGGNAIGQKKKNDEPSPVVAMLDYLYWFVGLMTLGAKKGRREGQRLEDVVAKRRLKQGWGPLERVWWDLTPGWPLRGPETQHWQN